MIDLILLVIFLGTASYAILTVWRKIPLLTQVSQRLIDESFVTRPSHLKQYLEPLLYFFRQKRYRDFYYLALVKALHWARLRLLRLERRIFVALEALQARNSRLADNEKQYWNGLKQWKRDVLENGNHIPHAIFNPEPPPDVVKSAGKARGKIIWKNSPNDKTPG